MTLGHASAREITVNGAAISCAAIAQEIQHHPADNQFDAWTSATRALVVRELLLQEARRQGLAAIPITDSDGRVETNEEALIRTLISTATKPSVPDDEACQRVYDRTPQAFATPDLMEVSHILLAADPADAHARIVANSTAEQLIATLTQHPDRFEALAAAHSACPSKQVGGSLGQIGPGETVPEFETALAEAPVGIVAPEPVPSRYGIHVVLVARRITGMPMSFDDAKPHIRHWLMARAERTAAASLVARLAAAATITGFTLTPPQ